MANFIVGLTGGIGSGKSTVADAFVALGAALVDTDAIAHELTAPGGDAMPAIVADFGAEIAEADGRLNRAMMRQRVFADPSARKRLEAILHPLIRQRATAQCQAATAPYVILAVPLLIESGAWQERCDRVLVVDCQESAQISRVMARSALAEKDVRAILATQASRAERLAVADDVIDNDGSQDVLAAQVGALHRSYLQLAGKKLHANR